MARIKRRNDVTLLKSRHGFYRSCKTTPAPGIVVTRVRGIVSRFFTTLVACFAHARVTLFTRVEASLIS